MPNAAARKHTVELNRSAPAGAFGFVRCCTQPIFIVHRERMAGKNFDERHSGFLRISNPCVEIRELQLGIIRSCGIATCKAIRET